MWVFSGRTINAGLEFKNIKCEIVDEKLGKFEYCYLRSVNRTYKYLTARLNVYKNPITKVKLVIGLQKRSSGYKPFLYSFTFDGCQLLENYKGNNEVAKLFLRIFFTYSNINHTCPFDHDLIMDKLPTSFLQKSILEVLPFPEGDYAFYTRWNHSSTTSSQL
ncbi:uncharacterized protein [Drosophila tropicalis]|uniref:uncharacterized protein n=1 Tax=Drosophila tropicalis TaxID=46794 RepID=UPI0035AB87D8